MIILPDQARVLPGHSPACSCQKCAEAWNERTKELQKNAMRSMVFDAQISQKQVPDEARSDDVNQATEEEEQ